MSSFELEEPWGQLVSVNLAREERIPIVGNEFTIGRGKNSDMIVDNKCVSSSHCMLLRNSSGEVLIKDLSTNGTLVGSRILRREQTMKLQDGDIIKLVHRRDQPGQDVTYRFVDLMPSETSTLEKTQEYVETESDVGSIKRSAESGDSPPPKRRAEVGVVSGEGGPQIRDGVGRSGEEGPLLTGGPTPTMQTLPPEPPKPVVLHEPPKPAVLQEPPEPPKPAILQEPPEPPKPAVLQEPSEPPKPAVLQEPSEPPKPAVLQEPPEPPKPAVVQELSEPPKPVVLQESPKPSKPALVKRDSMEESLLCGICQEILHDCVSLQPCMHSYCAGCYSDWMAMSNKCPACRNTVDRISKNHIVNNLALAYLRANPDKKRSDEYLKELDEKNKITKDMLYPKHTRKSHTDSDEDGSDEVSPDDSDGSDDRHPLPPFMLHTTFTPFAVFMPPPPTRCRQCPGYSEPFIGSAHPAPPTYTCPVDGNHVLCTCCAQPMPDRRSEAGCPRPQKCELCGRAFCHMYWGCRKLGCRGCLNSFKDIDFDNNHLTDLINGNLYESKILKDYLTGKGMSIKDLSLACCTRLRDGVYTAVEPRLHPETHTCYQCALKGLQELAYLFRRDIPSDELPGTVTSRSDCYWGKMCRTQKSKPQHAENFNHICEQTRHI